MAQETKSYRQVRHEEAVRFKRETGRKIVGVFCCDVPEELIHAAGMVPVRIMGEHEDPTEAGLHLPVNVCPYPKSCLDQALKGRYDYLDGLVVPNVCDMVRAIYGFWKISLKVPFVYFLEVPQKTGARAAEFFAGELAKFKNALEELSGRQITEAALRRSIGVYNQDRVLLHRANELRRAAPPRLSAVHMQEMVLSSMLMPKEEHVQRMLEQLQEASTSEPLADGVRVFLSASMLDDTDLVEVIEQCGGRVVADDMPAGTRYFYSPVKPQSDPLRALAERYLNDVPCPRKVLPQERFEHIKRMLSGSRAAGAIIHSLKACDCHLYEYPYMKQRLEEEGLPVLFFRGEETAAEREQIRDNVEAFIEMLRE